MSNLTSLFFTIVTKEDSPKTEMELCVQNVQEVLGENWKLFGIGAYFKYNRSYKIELKSSLVGKSAMEISHFALMLTDRIVSPWLVYVDDETNNLELIFKKNVHSKARRPIFEMILWAHFQTGD